MSFEKLKTSVAMKVLKEVVINGLSVCFPVAGFVISIVECSGFPAKLLIYLLFMCVI
jgi:hypothetical protein